MTWTVGLVMECELVVTEEYFLQTCALEICTVFEALVLVHAESWVGCVQSWLENWEHWNWESCSGKNCHQLRRDEKKYHEDYYTSSLKQITENKTCKHKTKCHIITKHCSNIMR